MQHIIKISFFLTLLFAINTSQAQKTVKAAQPAVAQKKKDVQMTFEKETIHLGKMKKGEKRTFDYVFTNTGLETIEIEIASGCDCSTLDWTRKPIKPGDKGIVNVIFDSHEKEISEKSVDVDIYLKNKDKKTNSQILKIVNFTFDLHL